MIRLAWIQSRIQTSVAAAGLLLVGALLLVTGPHLADLYRSQIASCSLHHDCPAAHDAFLRTDHTLYGLLGYLVLVVPAIIGVFFGAPLVARELETGTHRLAWTQSVSRPRWLAMKLAVVALSGLAVTGLLSLFLTWWAHPLDRVRMDQYGYFDQRSIVPVAYAAFAVALGVTCGILIRRTLPAMAATLAGFVAARLAVAYLIRPQLLPQSHTNTPLSFANGLGFVQAPSGVTFVAGNPTIPNAMVVSSRIADAAGHTATAQRLHAFVERACPAIAHPASPPGAGSRGPANPTTFNHCVQRLSSTFHLATTYQPPSRYWPLQWSEAAIFTAATLILVGVSLWRIRRAHS